jgi:S1-C subfamily serine protease
MALRSFFLLIFLLGVAPRLEAQSNKYLFNGHLGQWQDSVVRIFCQDYPGDPVGIQAKNVPLDDGSNFPYFESGSTGTGFLINNDGYIVTNNHVVATSPTSRQANKLILVVETVSTSTGKRRLVHKAKVLWLSPEDDLAVIQCPGMKARPIPLDFSQPQRGDNVHTMGYPGISDEIATNEDKLKNTQQELLDKIQPAFTAEFVKENGRNPSDQEQEKINQLAARTVVGMTQNYEFLSCMMAIAEEINPTWGSQDTWDITDVVDRNTWHTYFDVTRTDGSIQNLTEGHSYAPDTTASVSLIQHSLAIHHGNSGGPLFSDQGGVLGVVGDGLMDTLSANETERVDYATSVSELMKWMKSDSSRHYYKLVSPRTSWMYVIVGILLATAGALLFIGLGGQKNLARFLAPVPGAKRAVPPVIPISSEPTVLKPGTPRPAAGWKLTGRSPSNGRTLQVDFNESLFARHGGLLIIGRSPDLCHLVLETDDVSRQHAQIRKDGSRFLIADRNSSNRTAVNGKFTGAPFAEVPLVEGDTLTFGEVKVEFGRK